MDSAKALREQLLLARDATGSSSDLRDNAGRFIDAALLCTRLFLAANARIVALDFARRNNGSASSVMCRSEFTAPVALLVNGGQRRGGDFRSRLPRNGARIVVGSRTKGARMHYEVLRAGRIGAERFRRPGICGRQIRRFFFKGTGVDTRCRQHR